MKAWQYDDAAKGIENSLHLRDIPAPSSSTLSNGELLVEVISASINPVDYKLPENGGLMAKLMVKCPAIPGLDYCGRVVATKSNDFQEGQLVFGALSGVPQPQYGTLAQLIVVPAANTALLPTNIEPDSAAAVGTAALMAYLSLLTSGPSLQGQRVFINGGSGGVGTFTIQFAKVLGAHVTASCSSRNIVLCRRLGADDVIDYTKSDLVSELSQQGEVYDLVIDNAGAPATLYESCQNFLKPEGTFLQVAASPSLAGIANLVGRKIRLLGGGRRRFNWVMVKPKKEYFQQIGKWMAEGKVQSVMDETFAYEDAPRAFQRLKTGRATGKLIIHVGSKN
jgi:NADPH:quinone reductase-like Zn-dependent oxidoreductase